MEIRPATVHDAEAILAVYAPYIRHSAVTFEYDVPDAEAFRARMEGILAEYPLLVAEEGGRIVGYAYAAPFHGRAAFKHSAEVSIYLDGQHRRQGVGRALYRELESRLLKQHVFVLYACITTADRQDDPYVTDGSFRFHEKEGYRTVGEHRLCGYKFGRWYSVVWMEKVIAERPDNPDPFIPYPALDGKS